MISFRVVLYRKQYHRIAFLPCLQVYASSVGPGSDKCSSSSASPSTHSTLLQTSRRNILSAGIAYLPILFFIDPLPSLAEPENAGATATDLIRYVSTAQGYSLLRPASWEEKSKAGADVLFLDPQQKSSTLGVTVFPVTVPSLEKFGSIADVGEKLLGAEKAKESTLSVSMLVQEQRDTPFGAVYDFVYELESTRGRKRIVNCVSIVNSKLYIVNGTAGCGKEACGAGQEAVVDVLLQAAKSLEIL